MEHKYYTEEQILEALSEVGVGAGDISELMSCLGRMTSAEPKTGKWKEVYAESDYRDGWIEFTCENCEYQHGLESGQYGWHYGDDIPWKYCPMCGMKMEVEE